MRKYLTILVLLTVLLAVNFEAGTRFASGYSFTGPQVLQFLPGRDQYPAVLQASNGSLWVAWQHDPYLIDYRTFNGTSWSPLRTLSTSSRFGATPGLAQLQNGTIILLWSSNQTGHWNLYYQMFNGIFSASVQLTSVSSDDFFSSATVASNSTLWVFWERIPKSGPGEVYYKTLKGNQWSSDVRFTTDANPNVTPDVRALRGGGVWVAWSRLNAVTSNYEVFYRAFNGSIWSSDIRLTSGNPFDIEPSLVQDRNGTVWLFWSREIQLTSGVNAVYEQKLFYKFSYDLGKTWTADTQLTFYGDSINPIDDYSPAAVQGADKTIWLFYSSDLTGFGSDYDIYYLKSNAISPIHDVTISSITVSQGPGTAWTIIVKVVDPGDYSETVSVSLTLSNITSYNLGPMSGSVSVGGSTNIVFAWNSAFIPIGLYGATGTVTPVPGQSLGNQAGDTLRVNSLIQVVLTPAAGGGGGHSLRT